MATNISTQICITAIGANTQNLTVGDTEVDALKATSVAQDFLSTQGITVTNDVSSSSGLYAKTYRLQYDNDRRTISFTMQANEDGDIFITNYRYIDKEEAVVAPVEGVTCNCPGHNDGTAHFVPGDVVHDGRIDAVDALAVLRNGIFFQNLTHRWWHDGSRRNDIICCSIESEDVNKDGVINAVDALEILRYAVGKQDSFARKPYYKEVTPTSVTP